jgi:hypothetical protein
MKEVVGKELDAVAMLTESVAELTVAVKTQNDVILVLLHNLDLKIPDWKEKADVEKEVGPKIQACIEAMREVYGRSETDKS